MNATAGSIAVYLETENPGEWREPEARALFLEKNIPSGDEPVRAGPVVASRSGYAGFIVCAPSPAGYARLALGLTSLFSKTIEGPGGRCRVVRVNADPSAHPWVRVVRCRRGGAERPLHSPVRLRTWTPLVRPFSILNEIREAEMILGLTSSWVGSVEGEVPGWSITSVRLVNGTDNKDFMFGSVELWSRHPMAGRILDVAILKGFGTDKGKGYGHLDIVPRKGSDRNCV